MNREELHSVFIAEVEKLNLKFPVSDISKSTGYNHSNISEYINSKKLVSEKFFKAFCKAYELDYDAIVSGKGNNDDNKRKVPLIGEAAAGTSKEVEVSQNNFITDYIDVGDMLSDSEAAFIVYGNSMAPNYPSGCVLGIRKCRDTFIQPGEIYMIVTQSNRIFKRLFYTKDKNAFICYSDNTMAFETGPMKGEHFYPPFEVPLDEVLSIYDITGMIKRTRNTGTIKRQA